MTVEDSSTIRFKLKSLRRSSLIMFMLSNGPEMSDSFLNYFLGTNIKAANLIRNWGSPSN